MSKRANGEGMIRQRADGRWEARIRRADGTRPAVYGTTQKEVKDKLAALRRDFEEGRIVKLEKQTVEQYLTRWLSDVVAVKNAEKTIKDYTMIVNTHLIPALGKHQLRSLNGQHIQTWLNKLAKGRAPRTVAYYRACLRAALSQAVAWRLIAYNPAVAVEVPPQRRKRVEAMSGETAKGILEAFQGHYLEPFVVMLLTTGMRPGEALGLRWSDIDLDERIIKVQTGRSGQLKRESSWRVLVLPEVLAAQLTTMPRWSELVFPTRTGNHRDGTTVLHEFQAHLKEKELPRMTLYALRHGHATLQLTQGASMREIMEQLGHTQISTTANIYTHVAPELRRKSAERMDSLFGGQTAANGGQPAGGGQNGGQKSEKPPLKEAS